MNLTGACACSAIGYQITIKGSEVADYCHCQQCRQASGAPVLAWVQVPPENFRITKGTAKSYRSSAQATRWFCADCGSQLYMTDHEGRSVGVTLGTMTEPGLIPPTVHGWSSERIAWFNTDDRLPRYPQSPPYDL
jgi:hypothetical protein